MKTTRRLFVTALVATMTLMAGAQQVNTLYFLENAPMRHTINPAFQPVSKGYINFTPLGWMSLGVGNNSLTLSDVLYVDPVTGKTITPLHPGEDRTPLMRALRSSLYVNTDLTLGLLNMGFRVKEDGFLTLGLNERIELGITAPKSMFEFLLGGGMNIGNTTNPSGTLSLGGLGLGTSVYMEIAGGYSHRINEQWTVGGKLKILLGQAYIGVKSRTLSLDADVEKMRLHGNLDLDIAGPINFAMLPDPAGKSVSAYMDEINKSGLKLDQIVDYKNIGKMLTPSGVGAAIDLGFTYKPIENLQITAAVNDLGFIYWYKGQHASCSMDTTFTGVGDFNVNDPAFKDENGNFSGQLLLDSVGRGLKGFANAAILGMNGAGAARMVSTRLNVGLDANFWENRIGVGILSATRLYNFRLYEEITIGLAFRPVNWFGIAASYSLMENGKYSNIGAGLSFMPYDGINMTLVMDYIPTSYAGMNINGQKKYVIPDKAKMVNLALGFSICWGSNRRDRDKDGVWDKIDMCPETPRGVLVDEFGCPLDEDHDGVLDYLDHCLGTPAAAIGYIDSVGCMLDTDGDGVEDYRDKCPGTPEAAWGKVDSLGCPLDTDGDGVPDYLDECPNTPVEARGFISEVGCPLDSDGDGVEDYRDKCPGTPEAAWGKVDSLGCPLDEDHDGVPDYLDECPNTPAKAIGHTDSKGCELDSDGDGVPDYLDECPMVPGLKENKGCPEVKREVRNLLKKAMSGIEFESGKATIKKKSFPLLDQIANIFIENQDYIIEVQGHTDNTGKAEVNKTLSDKRAHAVMDYLAKKGVAAERMTAVGYGQEMPIADNKTSAGRAKNRRVEFKITFEEVHFETVLDHADPQPAVPADSTAVAQ